MIHRRRLIRGLLFCRPVALLVIHALIKGNRILFEDIFEDFEDGTLCALCMRSERNSEALLPPSEEEYSMLSNN